MSYTPPLSQTYFQNTSLGLVWLGLANAAYIQEGAASNVIADTIQFAFNPTDGHTYIPNPPDPTQPGQTLTGYWNVDWGPVTTSDNSNMLFLVSFRQGARPTQGQAQGAPYFFAVAIRGTDTHAGRLAVVQQVLQDFNAFAKVDLTLVLGDPLVPNPARKFPPLTLGGISIGTTAGFTRMAALQSSYTDPSSGPATGGIAQALLGFLNYYPGVPLVVTGHSLGGCQTQIMTTYLGWQLGDTATGKAQAICPNAFAPSTAGDATFAAYYSKQFPGGNFYFNTLDVVPCGFADLGTLFSLWQKSEWPAGSTDPATGKDLSNQPGPHAPALLTILAATLGPEILTQDYARPSVGLHAMTGSLPTPQTILQMLEGDAPPPVASHQADALLATAAHESAGTLLGEVIAGLHHKKTLAQKATDGVSMLEWQHFMQAYYQLVSGVAGVISYPEIDDSSIPAQL